MALDFVEEVNGFVEDGKEGQPQKNHQYPHHDMLYLEW